MRKLIRLLPLLLFLLGSQIPIYAQTSSCVADPRNCATTHDITFAVHPDIAISAADIDNLLSFATSIIQDCNGATDVSCNITLTRQGALRTYGVAGDGADVITSKAERNNLIRNNTAYVKYATSIERPDVDGAGNPITKVITGAASTVGIIMARNTSGIARRIDYMGRTFAHEFMHSRGLSKHRESPGSPILASTFDFNKRQVDKDECIALHEKKGSTSLITTTTTCTKKIAFLVDDTGSMSQEIAGVRSAILRKLNGFTAEDDLVFQLVTYKDAANARAETTDLSVISSQISGLTASGGADCPEAVEEAINAVKDDLKEGDQVFIYTDASPRSGVTLESLTAELKAKGAEVSSTVSGDCFASSTSFASSSLSGGLSSATNPGQNAGLIPYSDNNGLQGNFAPNPASSSSFSSALLPEQVSSVEAFSFLARETGGLFAFIPEVNSSTAGRTRYENTAFNILSGGIENTVVFAQPTQAPLGSTLGVRLTAANEFFSPEMNIEVSFSDPGINTLDVEVVSPTEIIASINIGTGTSLDFKDVLVEVEEFDYFLEISGEGVFQVSPATGLPTLTGVSPAIGGQGDITDIVVSGLNTNFDASSTLSLGSGITISNVNAENPARISARINIAPAAGIGYRTLTVTTGTEVIDLPLAFLVTAPSCAITDIEAGAFIACDTATNSFSQEVVVTYNAAPDSGFLVVNGQNFPILSSPQTVALTGLSLDDSTVSITAQFSEDALCTYIEEDVLTSPTICIDVLPNAPSNLTVDGSTAFLVPFTWVDNSSNEDGFYLKRKTPTSAFQIIATLGPDVTAYTDTALVFGEILEYEVTAFNETGESAASNSVSYAMPANFGRLDLRFTCYEVSGDSITWDVYNPNTQSHPYIFAQWWSPQRDTLFAPPGNSYFKTQNNPQNHSTYGDDNITGVWWADERLLPGQPNDVVFNIPLHVTCATAKRMDKSVRATYAGGIFTGTLAPKVNVDGMMRDMMANAIQVNPNPFSDKLYIESEIPHSNAKVHVVNQMGQTVLERTQDLGPAFSIDLAELPVGMYLVRIAAGNISITKKVLKK